MSVRNITGLLGDKAEYLLNHQCKTISREQLHLPGPDFVDRIWLNSDRNPQVMRNLQGMYSNGRLANTGYLSILPVDQGIEHSAGATDDPDQGCWHGCFQESQRGTRIDYQREGGHFIRLLYIEYSTL